MDLDLNAVGSLFFDGFGLDFIISRLTGFGFGNFVSIFATFGSVSGIQITVFNL